MTPDPATRDEGGPLTQRDQSTSGGAGLALLLPLAVIGLLLVWVVAVVAVPALQDPTVELAGAGDIAACGSPNSADTAKLLADSGARVFTLGDNAYPDGADPDFVCFDQTWGRFRASMLPVVGNHEYVTPGARGYVDYFGADAGTDGYYATDVGTWRVYALNSECANVSCAEGSPQVEWLAADLAANPRECVLAMWHEPRFSDGPHGAQLAVQPFWDALYAAGAELVLGGHDHLYERFVALDPMGRPDAANGITEIVAGTGGIGHVQFATNTPTRVAGSDTAFGVLELWLHANSYSWRFDAVPPSTFTDSGSAPCHGPAPAS